MRRFVLGMLFIGVLVLTGWSGTSPVYGAAAAYAPASLHLSGLPSTGHGVSFPTGYPGNGVAEPSILFDASAPYFADANGDHGYEYVACLGGYYQTSAVYENPNLWVSHDGDNWTYVVFSGGVGTPTPGYGTTITDAAISSGTNVLASPSAPFTPGMVGWPVMVVGAGASGADLLTTISSYTDSKDVVLTDTAGTTIGPTNAGLGLLTPIVPNASQGDGNMSDPYLTRGPDGTYYILYNQFLTSTTRGGTGTTGQDWAIKGISASSLAGPWSDPVTLVASAVGATRPASPSAVWMPSLNQWQVYGVDDSNASTPSVLRYDVAGSDLLSTWVPQPAPPIRMPSAYGLSVTDAAIASGSDVLTSASGVFTPTMVGWPVKVAGAGSGGGALLTTISAFIDSSDVALATTASTSVNGSAAILGREWWHLNVYHVASQTVLLLQDSRAGGAGSGYLWMVYSHDDGRTWTVPVEPYVKGYYYRSAIVPIDVGNGLFLDLFAGAKGPSWSIERQVVADAPGLSIDDGVYASKSKNVKIGVTWPLFSQTAVISNYKGFPAGETTTVPFAHTIPWALPPAGNGKNQPRTVYVRFPDSLNPTATYEDDIIVDPARPVVGRAKLVRPLPAGGGSGVYSVRLHARESPAGISQVTFSATQSHGTTVVLVDPTKPGITSLFQTIKVQLNARPKWVRVCSAAGIWSRWRAIN